MKRFKFRLQRVERLRRIARRSSETALAGALGRLEERRSHRESLQRIHDEAENELYAMTREALADGASIRRAAELLEQVRVAVGRARDAERSARVEAATARRDLVEKARQHRVLERLRERRRRVWMEEGAREEQGFLDEMHLLARGSVSGRRDDDA